MQKDLKKVTALKEEFKAVTEEVKSSGQNTNTNDDGSERTNYDPLSQLYTIASDW